MIDVCAPEFIGAENVTQPNPEMEGDRPGQQRERLYAHLKAHPAPEIGEEEIAAHFQGMPASYWERVTKSELIWGLETIHSFLDKLSTTDLPGSPVVADWRYCPERGFSKVMICSWDRPGLLAKIAAAFTALRINILQADVHTRADNVALDVFHVAEFQEPHRTRPARLQDLIFLLEGALSEPPRFVSVWAGQFHKSLPRRASQLPAAVQFDTDDPSEYTVLRVEAADRLGLLCDILQVLASHGVNIAQAIVQTDGDRASDLLYLTDLEGAKIKNRARLATLRKALLQAMNR